jgi:RNase adaptor protein for sRNA GlmZ degradation
VRLQDSDLVFDITELPKPLSKEERKALKRTQPVVEVINDVEKQDN